MCGISGITGIGFDASQLQAMVAIQDHRGPDGNGIYISPTGQTGLGHNRLSIIDLSAAGHQPMSSRDQRLWLSFNGEIYNYLELREELSEYPYQSRTDTEVVIAAYERWGEGCLDHLIGMFAFLLWDEREQKLFAARDRFGVKPLYYTKRANGTYLLASEIKALHAAGIAAERDTTTWANYLTTGIYDNSERTFWRDIKSLPPGHWLSIQDGRLEVGRWYDISERVGNEYDARPTESIKEEYESLLRESVGLRFRSDVPVGINLSGGLDSSTLLGIVQAIQGEHSEVAAYTFITGDSDYDELPWVMKMLEQTKHPLTICRLSPTEVPALAESVQAHTDEPFGGIPTLCYARLFEHARADGVKVLLDGQGMDEQWAGYDYYSAAMNGNGSAAIVQGTTESPVRPECLNSEFRALAEPFVSPRPFPDVLRNLQYRDARHTKIPRALRFNDRVSMRSSRELREPFLDHRLFELAFKQPQERKIFEGKSKWLLREITKTLLPQGIVEAPKRPLQTPQREWLRGPLHEWASEQIENALDSAMGSWFVKEAVQSEWGNFCAGKSDNSFYVWQWINLGLTTQPGHVREAVNS
jgi:asparagine synthase (glutamine-hydrolysing)